jgi:hypothetical protein
MKGRRPGEHTWLKARTEYKFSLNCIVLKGKRNAYPSEMDDVGNKTRLAGRVTCPYFGMARITLKVSWSRLFHSKFNHSGRMDFRVELRIRDTG